MWPVNVTGVKQIWPAILKIWPVIDRWPAVILSLDEDLTKFNMKLFKLACENNSHIKSEWASDGKIFVRNLDDKILRIRQIEDFANFGLVSISGQNADTHSEGGGHFSKHACSFKLITTTGLYAYTNISLSVHFLNLQFTLFFPFLLTSIYHLNLYIYHMLCEIKLKS